MACQLRRACSSTRPLTQGLDNAKSLRARFGINAGLLSDTDASAAWREDVFTAPFAGKKRVPLAWPDDAIDEDQFEAALLKLSPEYLAFVKGVSTSWRVAARRVLCSARYQALHFTLAMLVKRSAASIAGRIPGVLARLDAQPGEAETPEEAFASSLSLKAVGASFAKAFAVLPVEWGLCEHFWHTLKVGDGRKGVSLREHQHHGRRRRSGRRPPLASAAAAQTSVDDPHAAAPRRQWRLRPRCDRPCRGVGRLRGCECGVPGGPARTRRRRQGDRAVEQGGSGRRLQLDGHRGCRCCRWH